MRHALNAAVLLCVCAAGPTADLLACGEKFLVPTRGTRFTRAPLPRQDASILVYGSATSGLSRLMATLPVAATLEKAGYRPTIASSRQDLSSALANRQWDLIVIDVGDARLVSEAARILAATTVLPVSYGLSGDSWKAARKQNPAAVKAPGKAAAFVEMIDTALERHRANRPAAGGRS